MNKKVILISVIAFLLIVISGIFVYLYIHNKNLQTSKQLTKENFILTYEYEGDNTWSYTVTEAASTSCIHIKTDALVMESFPEQVKVRVQKLDEPTSEVCSIVQEEYSSSGTFSASSKATVSLMVK
jgi:hypothetical protein